MGNGQVRGRSRAPSCFAKSQQMQRAQPPAVGFLPWDQGIRSDLQYLGHPWGRKIQRVSSSVAEMRPHLMQEQHCWLWRGLLSTTYLSSLQPRGAWLTHIPLCTLRKEKTQRKSRLSVNCEKMAISGSIRLTAAAPAELGAARRRSGTCFILGKSRKGCMGRGAHRAGGRKAGHPAHVRALLLRVGKSETTVASLLLSSGAEGASCGWHG